MNPDQITIAIVALISLAGTAVNVYVALYVKAALLSLKADVLATIRAETYTREMVDLKLDQLKAMLRMTGNLVGGGGI